MLGTASIYIHYSLIQAKTLLLFSFPYVPVSLGRCGDAWSKVRNITWTSGHYQATVLRTQPLSHHYKMKKKYRMMTPTVRWDEPNGKKQRVIRERAGRNERKQAARSPVWWEETGWNWPAAWAAFRGRKTGLQNCRAGHELPFLRESSKQRGWKKCGCNEVSFSNSPGVINARGTKLTG